MGRERLSAGLSIPRHRHRHGYVAVVLAGGYHEAGLEGRRHLRAGDVAVHSSWDAHFDRVAHTGAEVLNLPLPREIDLPAHFRIEDVDRIARMAERDAGGAARALKPVCVPNSPLDWPDLLAAELRASPQRSLRDWAEQRGLAPETLSRGFRRAFGITPARFRAEVRSRRAMEQIADRNSNLAAIAADAGYADQAHFTRAVRALTGCTPGFWRRESIPFKKVPVDRH